MARKPKAKSVEGEVVRTIAPVKVKKLVVARHTFIPAVFSVPGGRKLHKFSQREAKFVKKFLESGSLDAACQEIGIDRQAGERYMNRKAITNYLNDMMEQRALASGLTLDKLLAKLSDGVDGISEFTPTQLECMKLTAKVIKPSTPSVQVTLNQQNNNFAGPSPYDGMDLKALEETAKKRLEDLDALH